MAWQVLYKNRRWRSPLVHPYTFDTEDQATRWGQHIIRTMSELDEFTLHSDSQPSTFRSSERAVEIAELVKEDAITN